MALGKAKGRISVRRMKLLEEGNATMGVWFGKQIVMWLSLPLSRPDMTGSQLRRANSVDIDAMR